MKYQNTMLCSGSCGEYKPCQYIKDCKLCIMACIDENVNEKYLIGRGTNHLLCKREYPNFKPLTIHEFIEHYKMLPLHERVGGQHYNSFRTTNYRWNSEII